MSTQALSGELLHSNVDSQSPTLRVSVERALEAFKMLTSAENPRQLKRIVDQVVLQWVPIKQYLYTTLPQSQDLRVTVKDSNEAILENLQATDGVFSKSDKEAVLGVLRQQTELGELVQEAPPENQPHLLRASFDGFWALQKLDVVTSAALLIALGDIRPSGDPRLPHWLFSLSRAYLRQWESALFVNNPELQRRLASPGETVSLEEMELRLGIEG